MLKERGINCFFLIVGGGSLEEKLKNYCEELGLSEVTKFVGFTDNVELYMNITDINVNCSIGTETSSLALSEGMGLSIPCVVSDFGGNPYMVQDGKNGIVYPQGDASALADALETLCLDSSLYKRVSIGAKQRFENELNAELMAKRTYEYYEVKLRNFSKRMKYARE